jgi:hypothetical protein
MSDSQNNEDLEIRILKELTEIRIEVQQIKSGFENTDLRLEVAINQHKNECWKCNEFVKVSELEHKIDLYLINKQKRLILFSEFIKSIIYIGGLFVAVWYLKNR